MTGSPFLLFLGGDDRGRLHGGFRPAQSKRIEPCSRDRPYGLATAKEGGELRDSPHEEGAAQAEDRHPLRTRRRRRSRRQNAQVNNSLIIIIDLTP